MEDRYSSCLVQSYFQVQLHFSKNNTEMRQFVIFIGDLLGPWMGPLSPLAAAEGWNTSTRCGSNALYMLLSLQMNLAAITGSILCVRLSTHRAGLMVLFNQDSGLGRNWIQVGFFQTRSHVWQQDKHTFKPRNEELHSDRRGRGGT